MADVKSDQQDVKQTDDKSKGQQDVKQDAQSQTKDVKDSQSTQDVKTGDDQGTKTDPALLLKSLQEERAEKRSLQDEINQLRQFVQNPAQVGQPPVQTDPLAEMWETAAATGDYRKPMQTELITALNWRDQIDAALDEQLDKTREGHDDFNKYESKVKGYVRKLPLDQRAKPGVVELAYYAVRGQDVDNLVRSEVDKARAEILAKIKAGESVQGIEGTVSAPVPEKDEMTEDQLKVAEAMGLTPEAYKAGRKK